MYNIFNLYLQVFVVVFLVLFVHMDAKVCWDSNQDMGGVHIF